VRAHAQLVDAAQERAREDGRPKSVQRRRRVCEGRARLWQLEQQPASSLRRGLVRGGVDQQPQLGQLTAPPPAAARTAAAAIGGSAVGGGAASGGRWRQAHHEQAHVALRERQQRRVERRAHAVGQHSEGGARGRRQQREAEQALLDGLVQAVPVQSRRYRAAAAAAAGAAAVAPPRLARSEPELLLRGGYQRLGRVAAAVAVALQQNAERRARARRQCHAHVQRRLQSVAEPRPRRERTKQGLQPRAHLL